MSYARRRKESDGEDDAGLVVEEDDFFLATLLLRRWRTFGQTALGSSHAELNGPRKNVGFVSRDGATAGVGEGLPPVIRGG